MMILMEDFIDRFPMKETMKPVIGHLDNSNMKYEVPSNRFRHKKGHVSEKS
jgi:hypothetical protein